MAVLCLREAISASLWTLIICLIVVNAESGDRNGLPSRFLSVARSKRSSPKIVTAGERDPSVAAELGSLNPGPADSSHHRKKREANNTAGAGLPQSTVVSNLIK